jgi:hypothetical protein
MERLAIVIHQSIQVLAYKMINSTALPKETLRRAPRVSPSLLATLSVAKDNSPASGTIATAFIANTITGPRLAALAAMPIGTKMSKRLNQLWNSASFVCLPNRFVPALARLAKDGLGLLRCVSPFASTAEDSSPSAFVLFWVVAGEVSTGKTRSGATWWELECIEAGANPSFSVFCWRLDEVDAVGRIEGCCLGLPQGSVFLAHERSGSGSLGSVGFSIKL